MQRLVVIGGVAAGMSAAAKAKRTNPELEVVVYEMGPHISYGACGMPYFLAGDVPDPQSLIARTPQQMAKQGVQVLIHHQVTAIDTENRTLQVRDRQAEAEFQTGYDYLVLATGAQAIRPQVPGHDLEGVFVLRSLESGIAIDRFLKEKRPRRAVIIGGGYIGIEMAETFRRLGLDVTMLIRSGQVMRTTLDDDLRDLVHDKLADQGVQVVQGTPQAFEGREQVEAVITQERTYPCDLVLLGMGAQPNTALARKAGVHLGESGAIATDAAMRTNLPTIYAAGDCAEAFHRVTGKPAYIPLGSTANKQGRVAGAHIGGETAAFGGIVGTMVVRCFDLAVASTGLTAADARAAGFDCSETRIRDKDVSHYFPGAANMHVKLIADSPTGRLLGAQIIGRTEVAKRIDVLATALHTETTIDEIRQLDLAYAPPFSPVWDPILVAANVATPYSRNSGGNP